MLKQCIACGVELRRRVRPSGNRESYTKFKQRKHCSITCRIGRAPNKLAAPEPCPRCSSLAPRGQKFCSMACRNASYVRIPTTEKQGRNQAQKRYALEPCERCGATSDIHRHHRHHRDHNPLNNRRSNISFFCAGCHSEHHAEARLVQ